MIRAANNSRCQYTESSAKLTIWQVLDSPQTILKIDIWLIHPDIFHVQVRCSSRQKRCNSEEVIATLEKKNQVPYCQCQSMKAYKVIHYLNLVVSRIMELYFWGTLLWFWLYILGFSVQNWLPRRKPNFLWQDFDLFYALWSSSHLMIE